MVTSATQDLVDEWVAELLGLPIEDVWRDGVRVGRHVGLADYPGLWVLRRGESVRVSAPAAMTDRDVEALTGPEADDLVDPAFWRSFGPTRSFVVLGPSVHAFTDEAPAVADGVEAVNVTDLAPLHDAVGEADWAEAGFAEDVPLAFALRTESGEIVAAANLTPFRDESTDIGVVTHSGHRGQGHGRHVAAAATAHAVAHHGLARYRALGTNGPSRRIASSLGFEDGFTQLAIRPAR